MLLIFHTDLDSVARLRIHDLYQAGLLVHCSALARLLGRWRAGKAHDDTLRSALAVCVDELRELQNNQ